MSQHPDPHDLPIRAVPVVDAAGHEPELLLAACPDAAGATVEIDVDGHGVRVLLADLIDAVAATAGDVAAVVRA